jgi:hypothetical protein
MQIWDDLHDMMITPSFVKIFQLFQSFWRWTDTQMDTWTWWYHKCNSMEQGPWEADSHLTEQEIPWLLLYLKAYFSSQKSIIGPYL